MKNPYYYKGPNPTVDLVLINQKKEILLIQRQENSNACPAMWALPGGFIDSLSKKGEHWIENKETSQKAALRELAEETGLNSKLLDENKLQFLNIYEGNNRDPRDNNISWSKSHAFYYQLNETETNKLNSVKNLTPEDKKNLDDAQDVKWISLDKVSNMKLAFDHNLIIQDTLVALNNIKSTHKKKS